MPTNTFWFQRIHNSYSFSSQYLEGIEGAAEDEQAIVSQWGNHTQVSGVAYEVDLADAGVVMDHLQGGYETEQAGVKKHFVFFGTRSECWNYVKSRGIKKKGLWSKN